MIIKRITLSQIRNLSPVDIELSDGINIFYGPNASGKTSFLEAVHLLFVGKSFRSHRIEHIIQHQKSDLTLNARVTGKNDSFDHTLGMQRSKRAMRIRYDRENLSTLSQLASLQPIILIRPESLDLLTGGPSLRRRFIDWLMFHVEHSYHSIWSNYQRVLKQRNVLLKSKSDYSQLHVWDEQLYQLGNQLHQLRLPILDKVESFLSESISSYLDGVFSLTYKHGWEGELKEALSLTQERDMRYGFTHRGPHRADLNFTIDGYDASPHLSRGQTKLLSCLVELSQFEILRGLVNKTSLLLVDDLGAELDAFNRDQIFRKITDLKTQTLITTADLDLLPAKLIEKAKMFHVEHGEIKEVI